MKTGEYVTVNAEKLRCIEYMETGQQVHYWLGAGTWQIEGTETLRVSDLGVVSEYLAVRLGRGDRSCYVSEAALREYIS